MSLEPSSEDPLSPGARTVAHNLRIDAATIEILRSFGAEGIPTVLLKGPSISRWLYSLGERGYQDVDLLLPRPRIEEAGEVLRGRGFNRRIDEPVIDLVGDRASYAFSWRRPR